MSQGTQREGVLVHIPGLANHGRDEVAAADIVRQIAVECAPKRVVAQILNNASPISVSVGLAQLIARTSWKSLQEQWLDAAVPGGIDDGLVGQHRIGRGA